MDAPWTLSRVLQDEQREIGIRRGCHRPDGAPDPNPSGSLTGLALSGGGVRSATFSLGVLQGLREARLLPAFDYVSTVSGGGFTGGWWTAWLARAQFTRSHLREPLALAQKLRATRLGPWTPPRPSIAPPTPVVRVRRAAGSRAQAWAAAAMELVGQTTALASRAATSIASHFGSAPVPVPTLESVLDELEAPAPKTPAERAALERQLEEKLVETLNALADDPTLPSHSALTGLSSGVADARRRNVDLLLKRFPDELERLFPRTERIDAERAADYRNPDIPDGAIAAGADPVHHLRLFANYLTPRKGLLSPDTWRAAAVVSRNLILTWLVFLPLLLAVLFAGQLMVVAQPFDDRVVGEFVRGPAHLPARAIASSRLLATLVVLLVMVTVMWMRRNNDGLPITHNATIAGLALMIGTIGLALVLPRTCVDVLGACVGVWWDGPSWGTANWLWLLFTLCCAVSLRHLIVRRVGPETSGRQKQVVANLASRWHGYLLSTLAFVTVVWALAGFGHEVIDWAFAPGRTWTKIASGAVGAASAFSAVFTALKAAPAGGADGQRVERPSLASRMIFAVTPVLVLAVVALAAAWVAHAALVWTVAVPGSRLPALTLVALTGVGVCLVYAAYEAAGGTPASSPTLPRVIAGVALVPLALVVVAFLPRVGQSWRQSFTGWLFTAAVIVEIALAGIAIVVASRRPVTRGRATGAASVAIGAPLLLLLAGGFLLGSADNGGATLSYAAVTWMTIAVTWVIVLGWMADPNALALHTFYKARLIRAYLGASNPVRCRAGADINDPAQGDDIALRAARSWDVGGPYLLVNTTLNLVGGRDLTSAQRTAAAFVLSPLSCGSVRTGYRSTTEYMRGDLSLGAAVAASGAAASPNMGSRSPSAAVAMLLALFNVRLGLWVPTPHHERWRSPQAHLWPYYLLHESLSQTNDLLSYCYLTDGGHFDNTGAYALIERGCRYIVIVDDGADPQPCFEDIGDLMRRCRIDFGADIELDASGFHKITQYLVDGHETRLAAITLADGRKATVHWARGTVRYSPAHLRALGRDPVAACADGSDVGTIVWIKPALTGDETVDVTQYALQNPAFPQQTTADQWFDEAQFESYRRLGAHAATQAFAGAVGRVTARTRRPLTPADVGAVFQEITLPAAAPPPPGRLRAAVRLE